MKKLIILSFLILGACAKKEGDTIVTKIQVVTQNCSVSQVGTDAVVTCPDGTTVTLPQVIVTNTVETQVPVVVEVPSECSGNDDSHPKHRND